MGTQPYSTVANRAKAQWDQKTRDLSARLGVELTAEVANDVLAAQVTRLTAEILATEAAGHTITIEQYDHLWDLAHALGFNADDHLAWARRTPDGQRPLSPSGTHGPFDGERCLYCYANFIDVGLYALDRNQCPPVWGCSIRPKHNSGVEPDWAYCQLPEHDKDTLHRYTWTGTDLDTGDLEPDQTVEWTDAQSDAT